MVKIKNKKAVDYKTLTIKGNGSTSVTYLIRIVGDISIKILGFFFLGLHISLSAALTLLSTELWETQKQREKSVRQGS